MTGFADDVPIYRQIAERIKSDILRGTLGPDEQIMSTNQFAEFYRINPATAAKAFQQLVDEGVIYKRRGIGMFVEPGARTRLREESRRGFFSEVVEPMVHQAKAIGIPVQEILDRIHEMAREENES